MYLGNGENGGIFGIIGMFFLNFYGVGATFWGIWVFCIIIVNLLFQKSVIMAGIA